MGTKLVERLEAGEPLRVAANVKAEMKTGEYPLVTGLIAGSEPDQPEIWIQAVMLNTWPDPFIGTQEDSRESADATQMKRAEVITGISALIMAYADDATLPALGQNALEKARVRLAAERRRASDVFLGTGSGGPYERYDFGRNIIREAYAREKTALESLKVFASSDESSKLIDWKSSALWDDRERARTLLSLRNAELRQR